MAKPRDGSLSDDRELLKGLPQKFDVWQVDARPMDAEVRSGGESVRPWLIVVVSRTDDQILGFDFARERPAANEVRQTLLKAMREPASGEPHRPTQVEFASGELAAELRPVLEELNVEPTTAALDRLDEVFGEFGALLPGPGQPGLLDVPGVTPEAVGSFFDAAALYYEQAPWKKSGERPIQVECPRFESGPWYAVVLGQGGMTSGLILYDSLETLRRIQQGDLTDEESARLTAALAVVFGGADELPAADVEALKRHGWPVAGPNAYPSVYRMEPGLSMRPPLAWELQLLEGCLRAIPEFVRKKTRRVEPLSITAPVSSDELPLVLSWVTV